MKKISISLLTIMIASAMIGVVFAKQSYATQVDEEGITWYTVSDLLEYKKIMDKDFDDMCGMNRECIKNLHLEKYRSDRKYAALYSLEGRDLIVTEIKPMAGTLKFVAFNVRHAVKKEGYEFKPVVMRDVYIGWFSNYALQRTFFSDYRSNKDAYYDGEVPGAHMIFGRRSDVDGPDWLTVYHEEVEFDIAPNSNILHSDGSLIYKVSADNLNLSAITDYRMCLRSEKYSAEAGCRLLVSAEKGPEYFAIESNEQTLSASNEGVGGEMPASNEGVGGEMPASNEGVGDENTNTTGEKEPGFGQLGDDEIQSGFGESGDALTIDVAAENWPDVAAPNTGSYVDLCKQRTIEFPWWLFGLIAVGDLVVLWLFWPNRKNVKKIAKKY